MPATTAYELVQAHEGLRLKMYNDTVGKATIGYGRNLTDKGVSQDEATLMFTNDMVDTINALEVYPWYTSQTPARQAVLIDMAFNMGIEGLLKFKTMIGALIVGNHAEAAASMRGSKWATQVGRRAVEDCAIMETGDWPPA